VPPGQGHHARFEESEVRQRAGFHATIQVALKARELGLKIRWRRPWAGRQSREICRESDPAHNSLGANETVTLAGIRPIPVERGALSASRLGTEAGRRRLNRGVSLGRTISVLATMMAPREPAGEVRPEYSNRRAASHGRQPH